MPELVANLHWGKSDWRTLFMCATHSLYAVRTKIGPRVEPFMRRRSASQPVRLVGVVLGAERASAGGGGLRLDPSRCALIIQDMQNDVMMDGGAFASSGAPQHAREQNVVENIRRLAEVCRSRGVMIIHVWFVVEPGAPGVTLNAPLFEGLVDSKAMVRGTWGAAPAPGLEPQPGDHIVEKIRMSAFEGSNLEIVLRSGGRDTLINTGAWTNMSIEHTSRTAADKGYFVIVPEDCCSTMNADWHRASVQYAMHQRRRGDQIERGHRRAGLAGLFRSFPRQRKSSGSAPLLARIFMGPRFRGDERMMRRVLGLRRQREAFAGERALHRGPARQAAARAPSSAGSREPCRSQDRPAPPGPINHKYGSATL